MICKWCGNKMSASDTKCKRCGKEVPALSDCGGFYDIVSEESIAAAAASASEHNTVSVPEYNTVSAPSYAEAPAGANNPINDQKVKFALALCVLVIIVGLLVAVCVLAGQVNKLEDKLEEARNSKDDSSFVADNDETEKNNAGSTQNPKPTEPTRPEKPTSENTTAEITTDDPTETTTAEKEEPNASPDLPKEVFDIDDPENIKRISIENVEQEKTESVSENGIEDVAKWLKRIKRDESEVDIPNNAIDYCITYQEEGKVESKVTLKIELDDDGKIKAIYSTEGSSEPGKGYKLESWKLIPEFIEEFIKDSTPEEDGTVNESNDRD